MTSSLPTEIPWNDGTWTNEPVETRVEGGDLVVTARETSDAWRLTSYGFIHDTEHGLLVPFRPGTAVEVEFTADFSEQFDQAGIFIRRDDDRWVKAATEFSDGQLNAGAVVTNGYSDWSLARVSQWLGKRVLIRASWADHALTIRGGIVGEPLRLLRVAPFEESDDVMAGPLICAPTRSGLTIRFHSWRITKADQALHP
ncbi:DUF1349 domain-containing protein [Schaalia sp. ZJ405]|uniref:DUF1349 domain-containing protein n=1 Tax=Schaalia sp. ZJ405 TaxID=2709403 RepID=UPI001E34A797|nr:DUF1349 domain-containing protein [Schaalia sp. ZJ405]